MCFMLCRLIIIIIDSMVAMKAVTLSVQKALLIWLFKRNNQKIRFAKVFDLSEKTIN